MLYITGITGHSGRWLFERLKKENYSGPIRCVVRKNSDIAYLKHNKLNIETVVGDITDKDFLEKTMKSVEIVLHIAGINLVQNIIEAAIYNKVPWAICINTTGRFSKYKSASADYIRIEDDLLRKRDIINLTIVRPTMIYGSSLDRNIYKLVDYIYKHKFFPMFGKGKNLMQPVYAKDLGNAYYDIIKNSQKTLNKEYNLAGSKPHKYVDIVRIVSKVIKRKTIIIKLPLWFSIIAAKVYNAINRNALISVEQVLRMQEDKAFDYSLATKDFGYNPISFEEGIMFEIEDYLNQKVITR